MLLSFSSERFIPCSIQEAVSWCTAGEKKGFSCNVSGSVQAICATAFVARKRCSGRNRSARTCGGVSGKTLAKKIKLQSLLPSRKCQFCKKEPGLEGALLGGPWCYLYNLLALSSGPDPERCVSGMFLDHSVALGWITSANSSLMIPLMSSCSRARARLSSRVSRPVACSSRRRSPKDSSLFWPMSKSSLST